MSLDIKKIKPRHADSFVGPSGRTLPPIEVTQEQLPDSADDFSAWDRVDESSWESFPASDPPSWI